MPANSCFYYTANLFTEQTWSKLAVLFQSLLNFTYQCRVGEFAVTFLQAGTDGWLFFLS